MKSKKKLWRGLTALSAFLLAFSLFMTELLMSWSGQVNVFLKITPPVIQADESSMYYKSKYELSDQGLAEMLVDSDKHDVQTMEEGTVLLKNNQTSLPLRAEERSVTLFGRATADPVYSGNSGGPGMDEKRQVNLYNALKEAGFTINDKLFDAYKNSDVARAKASPDWFIGEVDKNFYTSDLQATYQDNFNDVAIVMLSRDGGEGKDLATTDRDGMSYLALHNTEKDLLKMIKDSGKFSKIVVLINSAYAMELGWLEEQEYGVDAALWIGNPGLKGFTGVANVLVGAADPSGRLVDTFAADSLSAPAVRNAGDFQYSNDNGHYIIQAEGIYQGYKYYETRYHDAVLGLNNADSSAGAFVNQERWSYADEMVYPFGYGTSYANFTQQLTSVEWDRNAKTVTAQVKVTNEGYPQESAYTGKSKSVVQVYAQLPYEEGQAEKSAIQLVGFGKTSELAAGESEDVTVTIDDYLFATYDENAENGADPSKKGSYVFDPGDYYFAIGNDSHDALNNVMANKQGAAVAGKLLLADGSVVDGDANKAVSVPLETLDNVTYAKSQQTDEVVSNQYEDIDYNYFAENVVTYLTRNDWGTYPKAYTDVEATDKLKEVLYNEKYQKPSDAPAYDSFAQGVDAGLKLVDMKDVPFDDDEKWNTFLSQLTIAELSATIGENFGQPAVKSINKPANKNTDGPSGAQSNYLFNNGQPSTAHVSQIVAASTWNQQLLAERGDFIAEDALFSGTTQLWSPGANLHRTPFSGRNFEYYSEDSILSYIMGAVQTEAMQAKGLTAAIKHFVANDQETNRSELATFATEQSYRQGPLKAFEGAFTKGEALGTMMSFSRIGARLAYADHATLTQVLRNEWGFKGVTITDSVKGNPNIPTVESLVAGTDTFNADTARASEIHKYLASNKDGYVLQELRRANKGFYYSLAKSNLINGLSAETEVEDFVPWWQTFLRVTNYALGAFTLLSLILFIRTGYARRIKGV
ncbi:glycoside hydrolase family 3 protein [Paenibacillus amylolyticus]|uniref:Glycoside hydrolase n=1 Tax=Paenibacillus amylolyticus TaxID=1451 RepID=A0A100VNU7_PAEAM|nr:glycoside hydrolase family 3 protein [Paenibacillus amylolyticus]GAS83332.1 glycoside hydrolase [Paenibacillus amylolyticus]